MLRRRLMQSGGIPKGAVDLGLPSGLLWAQGNIVKNENTYSIGEETDYGCYFSWGNIDGHNEGDGYNFNSTTYNSTAGKSLTASIAQDDAVHDATLARLGSPWHLPTKENFQELHDNTDKVWTTINGVNGQKFMKKTDHSVYIFIPAAGYYSGTSLYDRGDYVRCWSSSYNSSSRANCLHSSKYSSAPQSSNNRYHGYSVRAVYGVIRYKFSSYKIYVSDSSERPHTSFTPNTDILVVLHNTEYNTTSYIVIGEFKAGISYPILTQDSSGYYLVDETNKEITISNSYLITNNIVNTSIVFPNGHDGQEIIGTFDDGTEVVTDCGNLWETDELKIKGENAIVSTEGLVYDYVDSNLLMGL